MSKISRRALLAAAATLALPISPPKKVYTLSVYTKRKLNGQFGPWQKVTRALTESEIASLYRA